MARRAVVAVVAVALIAGVAGGAWLLFRPRRAVAAVGGAPTAPPGGDPDVNAALPSILIGEATGYQDVTREKVTVDTTHLDGYYQYGHGIIL